MILRRLAILLLLWYKNLRRSFQRFVVPKRKMRLKIETTPPLPPLKTWLNVSSGIFGFGTRTFSDLCKRLVSEFSLPKGIQLEYDGFGLYGKDAIESLLEKDSLVRYNPGQNGI
jgi:hypothetical protein